MTQIVLLDSTPVGLITNPKATTLAIECQQWLESLLDRGYQSENLAACRGNNL